MSTVRCTVLSPFKFAKRVYRGGEVDLPAVIAAELERGGCVKPVPVIANPQGDGDRPPATNTPNGEPAQVDAGSAAMTTEPAGGTTPPAGDGDRGQAPKMTPESDPAHDDAGGDRGAAVTSKPAGGRTPPAGEAVATATATKPTKPKKAAK